MKKNYKMKRTISVKMFISELGQNFSEHVKKRLLDLEVRCVLTRKDDNYKVDIKHVEHTKYNCGSENGSSISQKEYAYGKFIVVDELLYFAEKCTENDTSMQSPVVDEIYNSLSSENMILDQDTSAKLVNDSNIDHIIDSILKVCPQVSKKYLEIVKGMISRSDTKQKNTTHVKSY